MRGTHTFNNDHYKPLFDNNLFARKVELSFFHLLDSVPQLRIEVLLPSQQYPLERSPHGSSCERH
jgi:hypothetical protein